MCALLRNPVLRFSILMVVILALAGGGALLPAAAQDGGPAVPDDEGPQPPDPSPTPTATLTPTATAPPTNTPVPQIHVSGAEPTRFTAGNDGVLSVFGANFAETTTVRLLGYGLLETSYVNTTALRAMIPGSLPVGQYTIEVRDPLRGVMSAPVSLLVVAPPATPRPTNPPPTAWPTNAPPTPAPGQPSLVIRGFTATPSLVAPGATATLNFEVVNQGNRTAEGVSLAITSGSQFVPANGQASALLPNLGPGGTTGVTLRVLVPMDAAAGPHVVPVTMTFRDFSGQTYTSDSALSISVAERQAPSEASQLIVSRFETLPNPAAPGADVAITIDVTNTGNLIASQVLLRIPGGENVLLAGTEGDSFALGEIAPGETTSRQLAMIVRGDAAGGPQAQPLVLSYLQSGEAMQVETSMTVNILAAEDTAPLLLLDSYSTGADVLKPGDQFTLALTIINVGDAAAPDVLVSFGAVNGDPGTTSGGSSPAGATFAPLGSGGTIFAGAIDAEGGRYSLEQTFIISSTVQTGIYNLPVTLSYPDPATPGESVQTNLNASIVVVAPPRLTVEPVNPVPPQIMFGEPLMLALEIGNLGESSVTLTRATVEADHGMVVDGASRTLTPLGKEKDTTLESVIITEHEGPITITVTVYYLDDLNTERAITRTFTTTGVQPPPPPPAQEPIETPPADDDDDDDDDRKGIGDFFLGLMGLGS